MVDLKILERKGLTNARLREVFTCTDSTKPEFKIRKNFEDMIRNRIQDGVTFGAMNAELYQAVDMAWDSTPIQKEAIPLMLYAQGKIKIETCKAELLRLKISDKFLEKDKQGNIKNINVPRLYEVTFSLIRSYVTRRLAAQSARFANAWPYFKYDPRGTSLVDKLKADVTSQRMDIMTDQYNYRHFGDQCIRDMFLYAHSVAMPTCAWDREPQWRWNKEKKEVESYVESEGVEFTNPHPTRTFWDRSAPLANINVDKGPSWIGYWDIVRYGTIADNPDFFNLKSVKASDTFAQLLRTYPAFFNYYFDPKVIIPPDIGYSPASSNDRTLNSSIYSANDKDKGVMLTNINMKVNPTRAGLGDYPFNVWMRFAVASDDTIVGAEFLPSLPGCYGGINEADGRLVNPSMAHELMSYQDQCTNILSQLLLNMKANSLQIWAIDQDALEPDVKKYIEETLKGKNYYVEPIHMFYSGSKLKEETGVDPSKMISIIRANVTLDVNNSFDAIIKLLAIVERLLVMSPNEVGQPNPREVSALETQQIATSVESIYSFIANGVDEQRAAMKRLCYEATLSCSTQKFRVAATKRYSRKTVEAAGFTAEGTAIDDKDEPDFHTIIAAGEDLGYDHNYTSRDGDERTSDSASARELVQLLQLILQNPALAEKFGTDRIMGMVGETARLLGVYDIDFTPGEGEQGPMNAPDKDKVGQLLQLLNQRLTVLEQAAGIGQPAPGPGGGLAGAPPPAAAPGASTASPAPVAAAPVEAAPVAALPPAA